MRQAALIPPGYLNWGEVHTLSTDFGVLAHVCFDDDGVYTGSVKGNKWEIRRWEVSTAQCVPACWLIDSYAVWTDLALIHVHECRSTVIATSEDHIAMKCFEVVGDYLFVCFASGKMEIYDKSTQALVRKPIAAHGAEIKHITRSTNAIVYTACVDNQVRHHLPGVYTAL